jgi:hypothetical protein
MFNRRGVKTAELLLVILLFAETRPPRLSGSRWRAGAEKQNEASLRPIGF